MYLGLWKNENGRKVIEFCVQGDMSVNNTFLEHKSIQKYTKVGVDQDSIEVKSLIGFVMEMLEVVTDVKSVSRLEMDISNHAVLSKIKLVGAWKKKKKGY